MKPHPKCRALVSAWVVIVLAAAPGYAQDKPTSRSDLDVNKVLNAMVEARGEKEKVQSITSARQRVAVHKGNQTEYFDTLGRFPDSARAEGQMEGRRVGIIVTPQLAVAYTGGQAMPLTQQQADSFRLHIKRNEFAAHISDPAYHFSLQGITQVAGQEAARVHLVAPLFEETLFISTSNGRLLRVEYIEEGNPLTIDYFDWKSVGGLVLPFRWRGVTRKSSGDEIVDSELMGYQPNPPLDATSFQTGGPDLADVPFAPVQPLPAPEFRPKALIRTADLTLTTAPGVVQVYLDDEFKGVSSSEGRLVIRNLPPGNHRLRFSLIGYKEAIQPVELVAGDNKTIEAKLEPAGPKPLALSEIDEALTNGISKTRVAALVKQFGVDFALTGEAEQRLRAAGADDNLLLAIAKARK